MDIYTHKSSFCQGRLTDAIAGKVRRTVSQCPIACDANAHHAVAEPGIFISGAIAQGVWGRKFSRAAQGRISPGRVPRS